MEQTAVIALYAIKYGIPAAQELISLFAKPAPTVEDWNAVWAKSSKTPDDYITEAQKNLALGQ